MKKEILCFTSGIDSLIAWFYLKKPKCIYFKLGHRYEEEELASVKKLAEKLKMDLLIKEIPFLGEFEEPDANIPCRNALIMIAASLYADTVWLVVQKGETSIPDRSQEFFRDMNKMVMFLHGKEKKSIRSPFFEMTKQDMCEWFIKNVPKAEELLKMTFSCFNPIKGKGCGQCGACFRKFIALEYNGIDTKDLFVNDIKKWEGIKEYAKKFKAGMYDKRRERQTVKVLKEQGLWK
jgi:7-cyano-7-deazaguanine synthase in queuosine biosynthesis